MELIVTPGAVDANSYATIEEADAYLASRPGFDLEAWNALDAAQKTVRLVFGALVIDSLKYRGRKATVSQSLQFPRIMPDSQLYDTGSSFGDQEDLEDFAALLDVPVPSVPQDIKAAQIEATFQIIHSHLFGIDAFESGEADISSLTIDVISMTFKKEASSPYSLFSKADFGATSTIKLLLQKYLAGGLRGELV